MKQIDFKFLSKNPLMWLLCILFILVFTPCRSWATFGEDREKPKPVFTRKGDKITAKLLPRAKSTSVLIDFKVSGAKLIDVRGMGFEEADRPEVNHKDFKSALFVIEVGALSPSGEAKVSIISDFFIRSTQFWVFNQNLETPWMDAKAQNLDRTDQVQELIIMVEDGGHFDSDGIKNGRITMVGGPKDSFWGYALGTLFIRYFGIFIVLSILMVGMNFSGKIFQYLEDKRAKATGKPTPQPVLTEKVEEAELSGSDINPEMVTAIAVALHLHFSGHQLTEPLHISRMLPTAWTQQGRAQIMSERLSMYHRDKR
jgi:hypothetical protein